MAQLSLKSLLNSLSSLRRSEYSEFDHIRSLTRRLAKSYQVSLQEIQSCSCLGQFRWITFFVTHGTQSAFS